MRARTANKIGEKQYHFKFKLEKNIYSYLWGLHVRGELDDNLKFFYYKDWEQYIRNKYNNYDDETLIEFSKYLNQRIRHVKPDRKYWDMFIPIILTIVVSKLFDILFKTQTWEWDNIPILCAIFVLLFISVSLVLPLLFISYNLLSLLYDNETEKNLLLDYKDVIEDMIKERKEKIKKIKKSKNKK